MSETDETFVSEFIKHECLWNKSNLEYKDRKKRTKSIASLAKKFDMELEDVRNKVYDIHRKYDSASKRMATHNSRYRNTIYGKFQPKYPWFKELHRAVCGIKDMTTNQGQETDKIKSKSWTETKLNKIEMESHIERIFLVKDEDNFQSSGAKATCNGSDTNLHLKSNDKETSSTLSSESKDPFAVCRSCLSENGQFFNMIMDDTDESLANIFEEMTGIEINENDKLPTKLCNNCHKDLINFVKFKTKALLSQKTLMKWLEEKEENIKNDRILKEKEQIEENCEEFHTEDKCEAKAEEAKFEKKHFIDPEFEKIEFSCNNCSSKFENYSLLINHQKVNKECRKELCDICGGKFLHLIDHKRIHSDERPFKCKVCGKSFKQECVLRTHMLQSHSEKRFKCPECDLKYSTRTLLRYHIRSHTNERPFSCCHCNATYTTQNNLNHHIKVFHYGVRYECKICYRKLTSSSMLKRHLLTHSEGEDPFRCCLCPKVYKRIDHLKVHAKKCHLEQYSVVLKNCRPDTIKKDQSVSEEKPFTSIETNNCDSVKD